MVQKWLYLKGTSTIGGTHFSWNHDCGRKGIFNKTSIGEHLIFVHQQYVTCHFVKLPFLPLWSYLSYLGVNLGDHAQAVERREEL